MTMFSQSSVLFPQGGKRLPTHAGLLDGHRYGQLVMRGCNFAGPELDSQVVMENRCFVASPRQEKQYRDSARR